ncbi:MAG: hypothetical protein COX43_02990 [Parcubacteria group bacterium CG23_combo_of_CG06-09_8_20_14_all_35_9]|nr:MAG: hypothetical protein COX43_02990 [Parcubacteria group bacterium CG23_combo_of_CG06-09_8_20_14_all_35_9]
MFLFVSPIVNSTSTNISQLLSTVKWTEPGWDIFILLFFIVAAVLYGISLGRSRIIIILVAIYMALAVTNTLPYSQEISAQLGINQLFVFKITVFFVTFILLFTLLARSSSLQVFGVGDKWWEVFLFGFLHVGLLISVTLSFLPRAILDNLSLLTRSLFTSEIATFCWIIAPIIGIVVTKNRSGGK